MDIIEIEIDVPNLKSGDVAGKGVSCSSLSVITNLLFFIESESHYQDVLG